MSAIGDRFRVGEVWMSPRGTYYRVESCEIRIKGNRESQEVTLRAGLFGNGRIRKREWDSVIGWVRPPEHNKEQKA